MLIKFNIDKNTLTFWLMSIFVMTTVMITLYSEFIQSPGSAMQSDLDRYRKLYSESDFQNIHELVITNQLGRFDLKLSNDPLKNKWVMTYPRSLPVSEQTVLQVLNILKDIKIQRIYSKDQINISNFSLNNPPIKIQYFDPMLGDVTISIGLVNPIDGSTYLMSSHKDAIYQVEPLSSMLESLGLGALIDGHVISMQQQNIAEIKLSRQSPSQSKIVHLKYKNNNWQGVEESEEVPLDPSKVDTFVKNLLELRGLFILDKKTEDVARQIQRSLQRPRYSLTLIDHYGNQIEYQISNLLNRDLPDLRLAAGSSFVVQASNRDHSYIVDKAHFNIFDVSHTKLKRMQFNEFFY